jgi:hypothetical protein
MESGGLKLLQNYGSDSDDSAEEYERERDQFQQDKLPLVKKSPPVNDNDVDVGLNNNFNKKRHDDGIIKQSSSSSSSSISSTSATSSSSLLPLPNALREMFTDKNGGGSHVEDDPALHDGRVRSFPHARGNWVSFMCVSCKFMS